MSCTIYMVLVKAFSRHKTYSFRHKMLTSSYRLPEELTGVYIPFMTRKLASNCQATLALL